MDNEMKLDDLAQAIANNLVEDVPIDIASYQMAKDMCFASVRKTIENYPLEIELRRL